jgi:PAS domain S-box-containing protein
MDMRTDTMLEPLLTQALDWVPAVVWVADRDGKCRYINQAYRELTGMDLQQCLDDGWLSAMHPDDAAAWPGQVAHAIKALMPFTLDCRLRRKDGRYRWYMKRGQPMFDTKGNAIGVIGCCWDVTSQKQALDALKQATDKHRDVLDNLKQAVAVIEDFVRSDDTVPAHRGDSRLTPRQREILQLIARGYATREIGAQLHVSVKTVESHRAQLMQRLNIHDVAGLTRFAIRAGMINPDS